MPQFFLWFGLLLSGSYLTLYYVERQLVCWCVEAGLSELLIASYIVCASSILSLIAARFWVRSAARLADDGFALACGLVGFSIVSGAIGLVARFDSDFAKLDIEMSLISLDPSEIFVYSFLSLPAFVILRLFAQALDVYVEKLRE